MRLLLETILVAAGSCSVELRSLARYCAGVLTRERFATTPLAYA